MAHDEHEAQPQGASERGHGHPAMGHGLARDMYIRLGIMVVVSLIWMYGAMFAMVDTFADVQMNLNFVYMAVLMGAPMAVFELALMWRMYPERGVNLAVLGVAILVTAGSFLAIRAQLFVNDDQFLESMIPHHSGAILMCREASISDQQVRQLCDRIIEGQRAEIAEMEAILERLD
jgi:hypothetical protein